MPLVRYTAPSPCPCPSPIIPSPSQAIHELKYSPRGGPRMLACGAADLTIYLYRADKNYQLAAK